MPDDYFDITKTGPQYYKELQEANQSITDEDKKLLEKYEKDREKLESLIIYNSSVLNSIPEGNPEGQLVQSNVALTKRPFGKSRQDKKGGYTPYEFENLGDIRANNQSNASKIINGIGKGLVLTGTTFMQTFAEMYGIISWIGGYRTDEYGRPISLGQAVWDNDFTLALKQINDAAEEAMPNYYTRAEQERPWWQNIGSANFIGDTVIKQAGFTAGAFLAGMATGGLGSQAIFSHVFRGLHNGLKYSRMISSVVGSFISSANEAGIEALNNSTDWADKKKNEYEQMLNERIADLDNYYQRGTPEYQAAVEQIYDAFRNTMAELADDTTKMANMDFVMNFPILMLSNMIEFGTAYSGGFKTARRAAGITLKSETAAEEIAGKAAKSGEKTVLSVGKTAGGEASEAASVASKAAEGAAGKTASATGTGGAAAGMATAAATGAGASAANAVSKTGRITYGSNKKWIGGVARGMQNVLIEGNEEMEQRIAQEIAGKGYGYDLHDFWERQFDPESTETIGKWGKAWSEGIYETLSDPDAWEEWFVGALMGAIGIPTFRSARNAEGKFQMPVQLNGGFIGGFNEYQQARKHEQEIAQRLTQLVNDPRFVNYLRGLAAHDSLQKRMDEAAINGDVLDYKNNEFAQLINDIMLFDNAGRLDELVNYIQEALGTDEDNLEAIIQNTSSQVRGADGKVSYKGPFVSDTGTPMNATEAGKRDMIDKINERREELLKVVKQFQQIKDDIDLATNEMLSDDQLKELVYYRMAMLNMSERATTMAGELRTSLKDILDELMQRRESAREKATEEEKSDESAEEDSISGELDMMLIPGLTRENIEAVFSKIKKFVSKKKKVKTDYDGAISSINKLLSMKDDKLASMLASNPKVLIQLYQMMQGQIFNTIDMNDLENSFKTAFDKLGDVTSKFNDIARLASIYSKFNKAYELFLNNPGQQREEMEAALKAMNDKADKDEAAKIIRRLKDAKTQREFSQILNSLNPGVIRDKVIEQLTRSNNKRYEEKKKIDSYRDAFNKMIDRLDVDERTKKLAKELYNAVSHGAESLEEIADPRKGYITSEQSRDNDWLQAAMAIQRAIYNVNSTQAYSDKFSKEYYEPAQSESFDLSQPDSNMTGADPTATVESVNEGETVIKSAPVPEHISDEIDKAEVSKANQSQPDTQRDEEEQMEQARKEAYEAAGQKAPEHPTQKRFYPRALPEFWRDTWEGLFEGMKAHEPGSITNEEKFKAIYEKLQEGFKYVNEGRVQEGDEVGFVIDPDFKDTIFIVHGAEGTIIGSLFESEKKLSEYEGMKELVQRIKNEYEGLSDEEKEKRFVYSTKGRIAKVFDGKIEVEAGEKDIAGLFRVQGSTFYMPDGSKPIFGIVRGNNQGKYWIYTGEESVNIKTKRSLSPGMVVLLVKAQSGDYIPMAIRVKRFNSIDFNWREESVKNTKVFQDIWAAIENYKEALLESSQLKMDKAFGELGKVLVLETLKHRFHINPIKVNGKFVGISVKDVPLVNGQEIKIVDEETGEEIYDAHNYTVYLDGGDIISSYGEQSEESISGDINNFSDRFADLLMGMDLQINVRIGQLEDEKVLSSLIRSGIFVSNIKNLEVRGARFVLDYFDAEGNLHSAVRSVSPNVPGTTNTVNGNETASGTQDVQVNGQDVNVEPSTGTLTDSNGQPVSTGAAQDDQLAKDIAWAQQTYGDSTVGINMIDNCCITPEGNVLDRTNGKYLIGSEAQAIRDKLNPKPVVPVRKVHDVLEQIKTDQAALSGRDSRYYYIYEEDGKIHAYERVHTALFPQTVKEEEYRKGEEGFLKDLNRFMQDYAGNKDAIYKKINELDEKFSSKEETKNALKIAFEKLIEDDFNKHGKVTVDTRELISAAARGLYGKNMGTVATLHGTIIDKMIRDYFNQSGENKAAWPARPEFMSEGAYNALMTRLDTVMQNINDRGERFLANNITVFHKFADGRRIAGELDILAVDKDGNFKIYDLKTSSYSFEANQITGENGFMSIIESGDYKQLRSTSDQYSMQLNMYRVLFESQYGVPISQMGIMPFWLKRNASERTLKVDLINEATGETEEQQRVFGKREFIDQIIPQRGIVVERSDKDLPKVTEGDVTKALQSKPVPILQRPVREHEKEIQDLLNKIRKGQSIQNLDDRAVYTIDYLLKLNAYYENELTNEERHELNVIFNSLKKDGYDIMYDKNGKIILPGATITYDRVNGVYNDLAESMKDFEIEGIDYFDSSNMVGFSIYKVLDPAIYKTDKDGTKKLIESAKVTHTHGLFADTEGKTFETKVERHKFDINAAFTIFADHQTIENARAILKYFTSEQAKKGIVYSRTYALQSASGFYKIAQDMVNEADKQNAPAAVPVQTKAQESSKVEKQNLKGFGMALNLAYLGQNTFSVADNPYLKRFAGDLRTLISYNESVRKAIADEKGKSADGYVYLVQRLTNGTKILHVFLDDSMLRNKLGDRSSSKNVRSNDYLAVTLSIPSGANRAQVRYAVQQAKDYIDRIIEGNMRHSDIKADVELEADKRDVTAIADVKEIAKLGVYGDINEMLSSDITGLVDIVSNDSAEEAKRVVDKKAKEQAQYDNLDRKQAEEKAEVARQQMNSAGVSGYIRRGAVVVNVRTGSVSLEQGKIDSPVTAKEKVIEWGKSVNGNTSHLFSISPNAKGEDVAAFLDSDPGAKAMFDIRLQGINSLSEANRFVVVRTGMMSRRGNAKNYSLDERAIVYAYRDNAAAVAQEQEATLMQTQPQSVPVRKASEMSTEHTEVYPLGELFEDYLRSIKSYDPNVSMFGSYGDNKINLSEARNGLIKVNKYVVDNGLEGKAIDLLSNPTQAITDFIDEYRSKDVEGVDYEKEWVVYNEPGAVNKSDMQYFFYDGRLYRSTIFRHKETGLHFGLTENDAVLIDKDGIGYSLVTQEKIKDAYKINRFFGLEDAENKGYIFKELNDTTVIIFTREEENPFMLLLKGNSDEIKEGKDYFTRNKRNLSFGFIRDYSLVESAKYTIYNDSDMESYEESKYAQQDRDKRREDATEKKNVNPINVKKKNNSMSKGNVAKTDASKAQNRAVRWADLTEAEKSFLGKQGYDLEKWDRWEDDEAKRKKLDCISGS